MPTVAHVVFIPGVLLIGIVIGFILGGRAAKDEIAGKQARQEARDARRAERGEKKNQG